MIFLLRYLPAAAEFFTQPLGWLRKLANNSVALGESWRFDNVRWCSFLVYLISCSESLPKQE